jgi:hypothetical protein
VELYSSYQEALAHCSNPYNRIFDGVQKYYCGELDPLTACPSCYATPHQEQLINVARATGLAVHEYTDTFGATTLRLGECPPGTHPSGVGLHCAQDFRDEFKAGEYFKDVGIGVAQVAALVASAGALTPVVAAANFASQVVQIYQATGAIKMGIDLGGIFGGVSGILGGISSGNYLGALQGATQLGGGIASAFAPTPSYATPVSYSPIYQPQQPVYQTPAPMPQAQPVGAFSVGAAAMTRLAAITAPILAKIAVKLGLRARPSLNRAMDLIRKGAKLLQSPEAVAAALGVTVAELATLITASNARKRRRMNPANSKALRRAARRIKSFHKLCTHTDVLKNRGRRSVGRSCGTCKKSPCRC